MPVASLSKTKKRTIYRHASNGMLHAPSLATMRQSSQDLSVDQPMVTPNPAILASTLKAMEIGQTHYVDVPGIAPLREKLAGWLTEMGLVGYAQANVLVTAGIQECRFLSIQKVGELYGRIGLPTVVHPGAKQAVGVRHLAVDALPVDAETGYLPTLAGIRVALQAGCRLLYLESPVRLSGAAFDAPTVQAIAALVKEFDAGVIWDQGLAPWVEGYVSLGSQEGMAERVVVLGEAFPGVGLESWPVGYIGANADWLEPMRSQKQIMAICTATASQYAALEAAGDYASHHAEQMKSLAVARSKAIEQCQRVGVEVVTGAAVNLLAVKAAHAKLSGAGFAVANGADFDAPGVLRLAVTADETFINALSC